MRFSRFVAAAAALAAFTLGAQQPTPTAAAATASAPHPLTLTELLTWKSIRSPQPSNDGKWFAYVLAPNEGDAEVVLRGAAAGAKELTFAIGEAPTGGGGGGFGAAAASNLALSGNGRWGAFTVFPKAADAKRARRDRRTLGNKLAVVELATGTRRDFDRVRAFRFAGDKSDWLAVHHAAPDAPAGPGAAPAAPAGGGTMLELVSLAGGPAIAIAGVGEFTFDDSGRWMAYTVDSRDLIGNSVQVRELATGVTRALDAQKAAYRRLAFVDSGDALSVLRSTVDSASNDTSVAVVGWTRVASAVPVMVEVTAKSAGVDGGLVISGDRTPRWGDTQGVLYVGLREPRPPRPREAGSFTPPSPGGVAPGAGNTGQVAAAPQTDEDTPSLILWHWKDPRLQAQQQVQEAQDKSFSYLAAFNVAAGTVVRLADVKLRDVATASRDRWAVGSDVSPYERQASVDGRAYRDLYSSDVTSGARKPIATKLRGGGGFGGGFGGGSAFSPDGERVAYYDDGDYKVYDFALGTTRTLTTGVDAKFWDDEDDHNTVKPAAAPLVGWSKDGGALLVRDNWDIWKLPLKGAAQNITANGKKDRIRYQARVGAPYREKGIDVSKPMYVETYGEWTKKEGLARVDGVKGGATVVSWEENKVDYRKARDADSWFFTRQTNVKFPDWYAADAGLAGERRLTDANPQQKDVAWSSGSRLITYVCDHGDTVQAALFLPANYEPGKKYPTLTYIYEKLSQGLNVYPQPNATRYSNPAVYTSRGYAFLQPDITYKLDDPGRSAVACVVPAVKAAIATGIVDPAHVGLQGHSWGGYQTSFITTQTDIFKTAIAGAPLTDMVSMFSSVYWNSGSANQGIFISSQGRFSDSYAKNPDPYIRNSPNRFATNLHIPFMILHNDRDGAVDFNQGITYYNTLRELGKDVVLLEYVGENHGLARAANQKDYAVRMQEWFDTFLRDQPAPEWLKEGVPRLQMEQHLKDRRPLVDPTAKKAEEKKVTP